MGLMESFPHSGDVHAPAEFGFDLTDPADAQQWGQVTGEIPVLRSLNPPLSELENGILKDLVEKGIPVDDAIEVIQYNRLENS